MATVNTVTGSINATQLGFTLMHEHVYVLSEGVIANFPRLWNREERITQAAAALSEAKAHGVSTIVDLTVLGLGLSALLSFAATGERVTVGVRDQAATGYTADGAVQAAVNDLRTHTFNGAAGQHCFSSGQDTLELDNFAGPDSAAVSCVVDPAKVLIQCPSLNFI